MFSTINRQLFARHRSRPADYRPFHSLQSSPLRPPCIAAAHFAPKSSPCRTPKRNASGASGEEKTGHIDRTGNEGLLFINSIYPLANAFYDFRRVLHIFFRSRIITNFGNAGEKLGMTDPLHLVQKAIPSDLPIQITKVIPRPADGGAFVRYVPKDPLSFTEVDAVLRKYLRERDIKPWFSPFRRIKGYRVKGRPFIDDLHHYPTAKLRVEFQAAPGSDGGATDLSKETLFSLFRRYGRIIKIAPMPSDAKSVNKFAYVYFHWTRDAISAKSCMHGYTVGVNEGGGKVGTSLYIEFEQSQKMQAMWAWLVNHPRIVIPLAAALGTSLAVAVFDPIRTFFITAHVNRSFHLDETWVWRWFVKQTNDLTLSLARGKRRLEEEAGKKALLEQRGAEIEDLQSWLGQSHGAFIVVQGPRGSKKRELVDELLRDRKRKLVVDCRPILDATRDNMKINAAAEQVGYWPVFSWVNNISSMIDLAAQGTIGTKTGFSETVETQLEKIFSSTSEALKSMVKSSVMEEMAEEKVKYESVERDELDLDLHPEERPVVVLDNFASGDEVSSMARDQLSAWAASLAEKNVAHVIFLTTDVAFSKSLSKNLPDKLFHEVMLGDYTPEMARKFVIDHLKADPSKSNSTSIPTGAPLSSAPTQPHRILEYDDAELEHSMQILGGRLTDLETLAKRIKSGETPRRAVTEIVSASASSILKTYLEDPVQRGDRKWSPTQAWLLVKQLAKDDVLRYSEVLLSDPFKTAGGREALAALEQAELISISLKNSRPSAIQAGKPVFRAAFDLLMEDPVVYTEYELAALGEIAKSENSNIQACEAELATLGQLPGRPSEASSRVKWLLSKVMDSQLTVEECEGRSKKLKETLKREF